VRLRADGSKGAQTCSDEGSEVEVEEEEEESGEFCARTTPPVPEREARAVRVQLCQREPHKIDK
jgi:hypothetical protein